MSKEYISVEQGSRKTTQKICLENKENVVCGTLQTTNDNNELKDVKELFIKKDQLNNLDQIAIVEEGKGITIEDVAKKVNDLIEKLKGTAKVVLMLFGLPLCSAFGATNDTTNVNTNGLRKLGKIGANEYVVVQEQDPSFNEWVNTTFTNYPSRTEVKGYKVSSFTNDVGYLTAESDPSFTIWEKGKGYTFNDGKFTIFPGTTNYIWDADFTQFEYEPNGAISKFYLGTESLADILTNYVSFAEIQMGIDFNTMTVKSLTINGRKPSLDGHQHSVTEITNMPSYLTSNDITNKADKIDLLGLASTNDITITGINVNGQSITPTNKIVSLTIPSIDGLATETYVTNAITNKADKSELVDLASTNDIKITGINVNGQSIAPDTNKVVNISLEHLVTTNDLTNTLTNYVLLADIQDGIEFDELLVSSLRIDGDTPRLNNHVPNNETIVGFTNRLDSATEISTIKQVLTEFMLKFLIPED